MSGNSHRLLWPHAPPWRLILLIVALSTTVGAAGATTSQGSATAGPSLYCYNWDFLNNTGLDVDGLIVRLAGIRQVAEVYTGPANPFGPPGTGSGYDTARDTYVLRFAGGPAYDGDTVHIGVCAEQPFLRLGSASGAPPFHWTMESRPLTPTPLFVEMSWQWSGRSQLRVELRNSQSTAFTLWSVLLLDPEIPLELEDLNGAVLATQALVAELSTEGERLAAGSSLFFDVSFDHGATGADGAAPPDAVEAWPHPGHPYVLEVSLSEEEDPGNAAHLWAQMLAPPLKFHLPVIRR